MWLLDFLERSVDHGLSETPKERALGLLLLMIQILKNPISTKLRHDS